MANMGLSSTSAPIDDVSGAMYLASTEQANVEIGVLGTIFAVAVLGNVAVISVLIWRRKQMSRTSFFILNLSISHLAVAFFNVLPQMIWDITFRFQGNNLGCKTIKFLQLFALYLSSWLLIMMAIDRYQAICRPLNAYTWCAKRCALMIGLAWLVSSLCSVPQIFIFAQMEILPGSGVYDCWATFLQPWGPQLYVTWFMASAYVVPLIVLSVTCGMVSWKIWQIKRQTHSGSHSTYKLGLSFSQAKLQTVKLTLVVVAAYLICWTPFFVALIWTVFDPSAHAIHQAFSVFLFLGNVNSCVNPWIYLVFLTVSRCSRDTVGERSHSPLVCSNSEQVIPSALGTFHGKSITTRSNPPVCR